LLTFVVTSSHCRVRAKEAQFKSMEAIPMIDRLKYKEQVCYLQSSCLFPAFCLRMSLTALIAVRFLCAVCQGDEAGLWPNARHARPRNGTALCLLPDQLCAFAAGFAACLFRVQCYNCSQKFTVVSFRAVVCRRRQCRSSTMWTP